MEISEQLTALKERVLNLKDKIQTEEATKNALVMPFIQLLGYDVFNLLEVIPEFETDVSSKKKISKKKYIRTTLLVCILTFISFSNVVGQEKINVADFAPSDSTVRFNGGYGYVLHPIMNKKFLRTSNIYSITKGTEIYSITKGNVISSGYEKGAGNNVEIQYNDSIVVKYAHLDTIFVEKGQIIKEGTTIGLCGSTGLATSSILGLQVSVNGEPVNAFDIFNFPKREKKSD